jgi:hypothetical protein
MWTNSKAMLMRSISFVTHGWVSNDLHPRVGLVLKHGEMIFVQLQADCDSLHQGFSNVDARVDISLNGIPKTGQIWPLIGALQAKVSWRRLGHGLSRYFGTVIYLLSVVLFEIGCFGSHPLIPSKVWRVDHLDLQFLFDG